VAPAPAPAPSGPITIWWPTPGAVVSGTQPFKALLNGYSLSAYTMYWQVDGGQLNVMPDNYVDAPHKEALVNFAGWTWLGQGPYTITFAAKDSKGRTIASMSTPIYVTQTQNSTSGLPTVPAAPSNLTASAGNAQVSLSWSAVSGATSYNVEYSTTSGGPYQTITPSVTGTSYTQTGLNNGVNYYYVVTAQNATGQSSLSNQASVTPVAPAPAPAPSGPITIWWPTPGAVVSGTQPFKALLNGYSLSAYTMYWQVDGGQLNVMSDNYVDAPHKEALVNFANWTWRGQGPYTIGFVAKNSNGALIAQTTTPIYVTH
jgi:hypothetical protein